MSRGEDSTPRTASTSDARKRKAEAEPTGATTIHVKVTVDTDEIREWTTKRVDVLPTGVAHIPYSVIGLLESGQPVPEWLGGEPPPEPPSADVIEVAALATDLRENRLHRALDDVVRNAFTSNIASAAREYVAEEDFDAMLDAIVEALGEGAAGLLTDPDAIRRAKAEALRALVSDWQANGNSRPLGDPTADVWQACAFQLLTVLDRIGGE